MAEAGLNTPLPRVILAPIASTGRAGAVACEAHRLSQAVGAKLTLLHVGRDDTATRTDLTRRLDVAGMGSDEVVFKNDRVDRAILRTASEIGADLIVAGALEKEGPLRYYVGSVARKLARGAKCSVLLLTEPQVEAHPDGHWVVATDPDETQAVPMLRYVAALAALFEPRSVHVVDEYTMPGLALATESGVDSRETDAFMSRSHQEHQMRLVEFLAGIDFGGVEVHASCLRGREGWEAAEHARRCHADLLVMAAPGRLSIWDRLFQHGVEFALQTLPCATLLYRPLKRT